MTNSNKIILGIVGAALAGVAIGMLMAPEKGGDARKKIADTLGDIVSRIGDFIKDGKDKIEEAGSKAINEGKTWADDVIEKTRDTTDRSMA